jgi:hypothetical protein
MGSKMDFTGLAWYGSAFVAILGAIQCFSVTRERANADIDDLEEFKRELPVVLVTDAEEWY